MSNLSNPIRVYEADLTLVGEMDDYSSAFFTRSWHGVGQFTIQINANAVHASDLAKGRIVMFAKDKYRCGIITSLEKKLDEDGKGSQVVTASGFELTYIFSWRITLPPAGQDYYTGTDVAESIMKDLIDSQCGPSADADRRFSALQILTDQARGASYTISSRLNTTVAEELQKCSLATELGFFIYVDEVNKKYVFEVGEGVDRTAGQSTNPRAIFSDKYDTIRAARYLDSDNQYRNYAYTAGQGIGKDRTIREIYSTPTEPTNLERKEMYVDARDLISNADLDARGIQKLREVNTQFTVDGFPLTYSPLVYRTDYDLGDLVTVDVYDTPYDARITSVRESWKPLSYNIDVIFDKEPVTLPMQTSRAIESLRAGLNSTEGKFKTVQATDRVITPQVDNDGGDLKVIPAGRTALVKTDDSAIYDSNAGSNVNTFTPFMTSGGGGSQATGTSQANGPNDASFTVWKKNSGGKRIRRAAWSSTPSADTAGAENGNFEILTMTGGALSKKVIVSPAGYTQLGADAGAPAIKMKKLTGTTGATEGSITNVAHGVTLAKILRCTVLVQADDGNWLPNSFPTAIGAEGEFSFYLTATNVVVVLHPTNSANLTGNAIKILLEYEE